MEFHTTKCPSCNAALELPANAAQVTCTYCNVTVERAKQPTKQPEGTERLLALAEAASAGGNHEEAYGFFLEILRLDGNNCEAWFGKARAAGWLSTLENCRLSEMFIGFERAIANAPPLDAARMAIQAAETINNISMEYFDLSRNHLAEFLPISGVWNEHVNRCLMVLKAIDAAHAYVPDAAPVLQNGLDVCTYLLSGLNHNGMNYFLTDEVKPLVTRKRALYVDALQKLEPSFQPAPIRSNYSACFVATATLGNPNHPVIITLRRLRDEVLVATCGGRVFIQVYELVGPFLAQVIRRSVLLRVLSFYFIVYPTSRVASWSLSRKSRSSGSD